jgi:hypothetical protein
MIGITYDENGYVENPFESAASESAPEEAVLTCMDGSMPDANGCCAGEIYTDMGDCAIKQHFVAKKVCRYENSSYLCIPQLKGA